MAIITIHVLRRTRTKNRRVFVLERITRPNVKINECCHSHTYNVLKRDDVFEIKFNRNHNNNMWRVIQTVTAL